MTEQELKEIEEPTDQEIENMAERVHRVYCDYHLAVRGVPYWTNGDYSKLEEKIKEADRYMARFFLNVLKRYMPMSEHNNREQSLLVELAALRATLREREAEYAKLAELYQKEAAKNRELQRKYDVMRLWDETCWTCDGKGTDYGETCMTCGGTGNITRERLEASIKAPLESTVARLREEREDWQASVKAIMDTSCNQDERHCTCVPLFRSRVSAAEEVLRFIDSQDKYFFTECSLAEEIMTRVRKVLGKRTIQKACDRCTQGVMDATNDHLHGRCLCECHSSPSPSANSGGRDLKTEMEMWDSNAKVEDWRLQRYGECAACGGNLTAGHQCPRRKSVSPGEK